MHIRLKGEKNVYEEIAEQYKAYILLGVFQNGEKLPSCRELAIDLGINPNTVERAYTLLENEGYVVTLPKKGVYVIERKTDRVDILNNAKKNIITIQSSGISYEELIVMINEIYKEEK